jgi:hypothetical protein
MEIKVNTDDLVSVAEAAKALGLGRCSVSGSAVFCLFPGLKLIEWKEWIRKRRPLRDSGPLSGGGGYQTPPSYCLF